MKTALKVFGIIGIVIGGCAMLSSLDGSNFLGFVSGSLFATMGIFNLLAAKRLN